MTTEEMNAFLDGPYVGAFSLTRADGSPAVAPVWYRWDGRAITFFTDPSVWWVQRVQQEPRVAFTVFEHGSPERAVYVRGVAETRHDSVDALMPWLAPVVARYRGEERAVETVRSYDNGDGKVLITIMPTSIRGVTNG